MARLSMVVMMLLVPTEAALPPGSGKGLSRAPPGATASSSAGTGDKRPSLADLMGRFTDVVKSPEFAELAGNLNDIVGEMTGQKVDIQQGMMHVVKTADATLGGIAVAAEEALRNYRKVHGTVDSAIREVRETGKEAVGTWHMEA